MTIEFLKTGHDPFIDFLKAYCIIWVVIGHIVPGNYLNYILYPIVGGCQVPLFLIIQSFHVFKKEVKPVFNCKKTLRRIVIPFFIIQAIIISVKAFANSSIDCRDLFANWIKGGGLGPGSYYFWIYLQFALILPWCYVLLSKMSKLTSLILFVIASVGIDILLSILNVPTCFERLLAARYIFLIYFGWVWAKEGIVLNRINCVLSLLSLLTVVFFMFSKLDLEPLFYNSEFTTHRWVCYFFASSLFILALKYIYTICNQMPMVSSILSKIGQCSYEIYLFQMLVFSLFRPKQLFFIDNPYFQFTIWAMISFILCIIGGIVFNKGINRCPNN